MDIAVSPATKAIGQKYGKTPTPQFEKDLEALEKSGDASAAVLLGELEDPILHTPELVRFREELS